MFREHPLMLRKRSIAVLFATVFVLAACSGPTGYTKADPVWGARYGYTDKTLGADEYSIIVNATPQTGAEQVADIALLRAAHIAKEHGRTHFVIVSQTAEILANRRLITAPIGGVWFPVRESVAHEPHTILIIRLLPNDGPRPDNAVDADAVIAKVSPRLGRAS